MTAKKHSSSKNFQFIKDGKLNNNVPRGYNYHTGLIEVHDYSRDKIYLPDFRELKS